MQRFSFSILLVLSLALSWITSYADLNIELTQGVNDAIPIAVVPFAHAVNNVPGNTTISDVIRQDLQNSGQFNVSQPGLLSAKPHDVAQVDFAAWRKQKINDLVIGQVNALGGDRYQVNFKLLAMFTEPLAALQKNPQAAVLLDATFTTTQAGLRHLAHHVSDCIYQKLTGTTGVFATKIAYVLVNQLADQTQRYDLEIADADGFNPQVLVSSKQPIMSPAWLPDGQALAYVSFEGNHAAIYLQNIMTGKRQRVSHYPGINGAPAFSPDGTRMALVLTLNDNPNVYVLDLSSKKLMPITHDYSIDTEPSWAPDGKSLIFTSNRGGNPQIYQYNFATQKTTRLTFTGNYNARASFLPDGQSIIMMHREMGLFGIARQDLQTGQVTVLVQTGNDESPSIAPNGNMIIYATHYSGRGVLAQVSANGQIKVRLPTREGSVREPAWSPFLR